MGRWSRVLASDFIGFSGISDRDRVLDVGCGLGSLTFTLLAMANVTSIDALDYSQIYVEAIRRTCADMRVRVRQGDATSLPYESASFDRALSLLVLQFIPDAYRTVREMRRVVRPGGVVAAAVWDSFGGMSMFRMFWDTAAALFPEAGSARAAIYNGPMTRPRELHEAWHNAGLTDVAEVTLTIRLSYVDFTDWWGPFAAGEGPAGAFIESLSPQKRELLERHLRAAYEAGRPDGPRSFAASAFACRGLAPRAD